MRASPKSILPSPSSPTSLLLLKTLLALAILPNTLLVLATAAAAAATTSKTTTVTLTIPSSPQLPHPRALLASSTHATLTGGNLSSSSSSSSSSLSLSLSHRAPLDTRDGFVFRNVTPGSYLADVHCAGYGFAPLRVDVDVVPPSPGGEEEDKVKVRAWETFRGNAWENRGEEVKAVVVSSSSSSGGGGEDGNGSGRIGFPVRVLGPKVYYTERGSFSVFGILKNPMILMGLVSMALFVGLPKLVENMDPEMRAEFEEQQKKNPMASLSGRLA